MRCTSAHISRSVSSTCNHAGSRGGGEERRYTSVGGFMLEATAVAQVATRVATVLRQVYVPWQMMCVLQVTSPVAPRSHTAAAAAAALADWETATSHCVCQQQQLRQLPG
jgi:hypothetical protein